MQGYTDLVEFLIKSGGSIGLMEIKWKRVLLRFHLSDGMTIKKQTPMHLAGAAGQKATCVKLLELNVRYDPTNMPLKFKVTLN